MIMPDAATTDLVRQLRDIAQRARALGDYIAIITDRVEAGQPSATGTFPFLYTVGDMVEEVNAMTAGLSIGTLLQCAALVDESRREMTRAAAMSGPFEPTLVDEPS
jgi:hypothetical protein